MKYFKDKNLFFAIVYSLLFFFSVYMDSFFVRLVTVLAFLFLTIFRKSSGASKDNKITKNDLIFILAFVLAIVILYMLKTWIEKSAIISVDTLEFIFSILASILLGGLSYKLEIFND